ncbi:MAG: bifunctional phosphopantothenoylcysteine decarboxylase/phosphopantothenate--cysteine ligase CoaBC [Paludibacteraceae bacterium]|nr:bifunctional phosphopantothenoylcysteine decarboxylase/phosphopantothenate--cysteine ligase CoaBC [Paludibacteraceae bacterium]
MLQGKHIVVGLTGSIAAYKTATLVRDLIKAGAEVQVLMTETAKQFITPLTLATLSKRPVLVDFFDPTDGRWNSHVSLGLWADAYLIAPASANTLAKMANGIADNLVTTTYLSARCPVFAAPAMVLDMYRHPRTQANLDTLRTDGVTVIEAEEGELASGLSGKGRMAEPAHILQVLERHFAEAGALTGKKVLITAGPTYEKIDAVRFIGNYSSGKMGFALAEACAGMGAEVTLITGPTACRTAHPGIQRIDVQSAAEMYDAAVREFPRTDMAILSAAVADFTPDTCAPLKINRGEQGLQLHLQPTRDIAATLGECKKSGQILVGFALETHDEEAHARGKLTRKHLDYIVLNSLQDAGAGFGCDTNKITVFDTRGHVTRFPLKSKEEVARDIVNLVIS